MFRERRYLVMLLAPMFAVLLVGAASMSPVTQPVRADHNCNNAIEKGTPETMIAVVQSAIPGGCNLFHGETPTKEELDQADAYETKVDLYQSAQGVKTQTDNFDALMDNYLKDTRGIALQESKYAFFKALRNDSTKSQALTEAKTAVQEYYAVKQVALLNAYETALTQWEYIRERASNETNVSAGFAGFEANTIQDGGGDPNSVSFVDMTGTDSVSLVNNSARTVNAFTARHYRTADDGQRFYSSDTVLGPSNNWTALNDVSSNGIDRVGAKSLFVEAPDSDFSRLGFINFSEYRHQWNAIVSEKNAVVSNVSTFIDTAYDQWAAGALDEEDFIDPYLGARELSPEGNFQTWTVMTLASLGIEPPENFRDVGSMRVRDETNGITYEGILLSESAPNGSTYEANTTYDAANIDGVQMMVTNDSRAELEGQFTVLSITDANGNEKQSVTYESIDYNTNNISEFKEVSAQLANLSAQIQVWQSNLRENATDPDGGISIFPGLDDVPRTAWLVVAAFLGILAVQAARSN